MDKKNLGCALAALVAASCALAAVPQPWTPVEATDGTVRVWGREYAFTSNALPVSLKTQGRELLAGPIRVICEDKTGELAAIEVVRPGDELMIMSRAGVMIRINVSDISEQGRYAQGVRVIRLDEGDLVAGMAKVINHDDDETMDLPLADD